MPEVAKLNVKSYYYPKKKDRMKGITYGLQEFDIPTELQLKRKRGRPKKYKEYSCLKCGTCTCKPSEQNNCQCWNDE